MLKLKLVKVAEDEFFLMTLESWMKGPASLISDALAELGLTASQIAEEFRGVELIYTSINSSQPLMAGISRIAC